MLEFKEISESTTGVAQVDGNGATWQVDIFNLTVPFNQKHVFTSNCTVYMSLVGDDAAQMPDRTLVRVVKRDMDSQELKPLLSTLYVNCKEPKNVKKMAHLNIPEGEQVVVTPGEHIAIMVNGADAATTGDTDASASSFRITSQRERKSILV